ncbi:MULTISPECIES: TnsA-like heteromeric transposase endonuclease subunit [Streptomyces]|uniref:TnsA-like heteromeric transposase endonuclease subunit n=1 Tax=Streptomyces TaxID=1883 RepID=UPI00103D7075|nr:MULTISPECIES: TnsA-like heteromeric transposase endonuclease subunit [Streptomyces]MBT3075164.1 TnsA-like heteromeric transposase endonuclease subunit [Streptomyces sp. COG21]MBT3091274.1 TnsA-like heteromeric transposase endonuclease subunit [Streptomyces sp. CYG21]MBT3099283.1 TnsA-like heteromeric transposase endonuclease subunit [Streptomyces sp. CBG30]MBT3103993.1 TnsA-like heteromeric transposase endonuclease subunit [Streptomyces sp. COG19]MBT3113398.1 TnsA-like heteromeric transposa
MPAAQAAGTEMVGGELVWAPLRHPSERSIVTYWWSATTGTLVGCRSLDRLSVAMLLDFHPNIVGFSAWTARLQWRERGRVRHLVPDFFVRTAAGETVVVACPPAKGPSTRWQRQQEVLQEACSDAGWQLGSPRLPHPVAMANLRWVSRYRHPRYADAAMERTLLDAFEEPVGLLEGIENAGLPALQALPRLYHLMWRRELRMNWSISLGPATVVRRGGGAMPSMRPFRVGESS